MFKNCNTYSSLCSNSSGVSHRIEYSPVPVDRDRDQAEYADCAQHNQKGAGEETRVQISGQSDAREDRKGDAEEADEEIGRGQGDDVVICPAPQFALLHEHNDDQGIAQNGAHSHHDLGDRVRQIELRQ